MADTKISADTLVSPGAADLVPGVQAGGNVHFTVAGLKALILAGATAGMVLAGATPAFTATPVLGIAGTTLGSIGLSGNTSGVVTIKPQAAAGTYNFNLPIGAGTSGDVLTSGGGGSTAMSWVTPIAINALIDTWTDGGTTYSAIKMDVTDTASAAGSMLLDLRVATVAKFQVKKGGEVITGIWNGTAVAAAYGGTGQTTYTKGDLLATPGSTTINKLAVGTDGQVLTADAASTNGIKWAAAAGGGLTIGTTTITSGTTTRILYNNAGVVGEYTLTGTGTVVAMQTAPTFTTSIGMTSGGLLKPYATTFFNNGWVFQDGAAGSGQIRAASIVAGTGTTDASACHVWINGNGGGIYISTSAVNGLCFAAAADVTNMNSGIDTFITRGGAAATLQHGKANADTNALIVAQTIRSQGLASGGTSDQAGKNWTNIVSPGKGTGVGGSWIVQTAPAGSTGTALNAVATRLTIDGPGNVILGSAAIATDATDGDLCIVTCAGTPTGTPTAFTGRVHMRYDTTNNQLWFYDGAWKQPKTPAAAALVTWQ